MHNEVNFRVVSDNDKIYIKTQKWFYLFLCFYLMQTVKNNDGNICKITNVIDI